MSNVPGPQCWAGPLSAAVARMCIALRPRMGERTAVGFGEVLRRLAAPLQVVVAGRIKAGKSTLVNALIGRRVAPTSVGECTRLVTRFQYGTVDRIEVVRTDGGKQTVPFDPSGAIPAELGVEPARISHLEVYLTNAVLRDLTVIDTPGLESLDDASSARSRQLLGAEQLDPVSRSAVAGAEAVLYVLTQTARADDEQVLAAFEAATAGRQAGPGNVVALLNKADTVEPDSVPGADGDVWRAATLLAAHQEELLSPRVAGVLPVIGLLAETAETGGFTEEDAESLRQLAELEESARETMLLSPDLFTSWDCAVPIGVRTRLLERLDLHGVRCALAAITAQPDITAGQLRRKLLEDSGMAAVLGKVNSLFRSRADGIKAAAALGSISALAESSGDPAEQQLVRDAIEALLARPESHQFRVLEALTLVSSGQANFPADLAAEVLRVGSGSSAAEQLGLPGRSSAELAESALERANWWRAFASFGATPAQSRVAHVVHRAYFLLWQRLRSGE